MTLLSPCNVAIPLYMVNLWYFIIIIKITIDHNHDYFFMNITKLTIPIILVDDIIGCTIYIYVCE